MLRLTNFKLERLERFLLRLRNSRNFDLEGNFMSGKEVLQMFFFFWFFWTEKVLHERGFSKLKASRAKKTMALPWPSPLSTIRRNISSCSVGGNLFWKPNIVSHSEAEITFA